MQTISMTSSAADADTVSITENKLLGLLFECLQSMFVDNQDSVARIYRWVTLL